MLFFLDLLISYALQEIKDKNIWEYITRIFEKFYNAFRGSDETQFSGILVKKSLGEYKLITCGNRCCVIETYAYAVVSFHSKDTDESNGTLTKFLNGLFAKTDISMIFIGADTDMDLTSIPSKIHTPNTASEYMTLDTLCEKCSHLRLSKDFGANLDVQSNKGRDPLPKMGKKDMIVVYYSDGNSIVPFFYSYDTVNYIKGWKYINREQVVTI